MRSAVVLAGRVPVAARLRQPRLRRSDRGLRQRSCVLHGAVVAAEDGEVRLGSDVVVMENAIRPSCSP
jgi:hypothetical protein